MARGTPAWRYYLWALGLGAAPGGSRAVPVFVMMPLEFGLGAERALAGGERALELALDWLAAAGARGVMVDVWWGACERAPREYDFARYRWLAAQCAARQLQVQATMSFHRCGGNVGDSCHIPLPAWVERAADAHHAWYTDAHGEPARECLSLATDELPFLPSSSSSSSSSSSAAAAQPMRTPLVAYEDFIAAFCDALREFVADGTVCELQVGCGPCGELRYPSYRAPRWRFPGVGAFQCYDPHMRAALRAAAAAAFPHDASAAAAFAEPPPGLPDYNDMPGEFFTSKAHDEPHGAFFRDWYSTALLDHLSRMLAAAQRGLERSESGSAVHRSAQQQPQPQQQLPQQQLPMFSVKISGVHWFAQMRDARPAELCAGYDAAGGKFYERVAERLAEAGAMLNFTCVEMWDGNQPRLARAAPERLVQEVLRACRRHGVAFAGENALENYGHAPLRQVVRTYELAADVAHGLTLLRLGDKMLTPQHRRRIECLICNMAHL